MGEGARSLLAKLIDALGGGNPTLRLAAVLDGMARPAVAERRSACSKDAIPWHRWPSRGKYSLLLESWAALPTHEKTTTWTGDLRDIAALTASKSDLSAHPTLDAFAEHCCPDWIKDISELALLRALEHSGIGVVGERPSDQLVRYAWDGRIFLVNGDGSHHLAAARYIAGRLRRPVPIRAHLTEWSLDAIAIADLVAKRALFAIAENTPPEFYKALRDCGAACNTGDLPGAPLRMGSPPSDGVRLVELNTESRPAADVADLMRAKGFFDVGLHVLRLAQVQSNMADSLR